jgi:uroporphyrinogen decarboxylase
MNNIINILLNYQKLINNKNSDFYQKKEIPIWIMRQAGRYLPEYREIRSKVDNFLDLCYNPKLASEITLQPIKRFNLDAAIIFSDILTIPDALGLKVEFLKNHGPKIEKIDKDFNLSKLNINNIDIKLSNVFEAISITKQKLPKDKALIGFSGSPFTLACYMIEGGGSKNFELVKRNIFQNSVFFKNLIDILIEAVTLYLIRQIEAGAEVLKLFDSWSGILPSNEFFYYVINSNARIVNNIKNKYPNIPIICFPRNCGVMMEDFAKNVPCDGLAIDQNFSVNWVANNLQDKYNRVVQGNLDNYLLAFGSKDQIEKATKNIIDNLGKKPFIFNLGHGILPETPIENVEFLLKIVKNY